jgi:hypothetical protein
VTFKGRPTSNVETIEARAKEAGLRVRRNADDNFDVDGIAARLRATPAAVREWLGSRVMQGAASPKAPAKAKASDAKVKPKAEPKANAKAPNITLGHVWEDKAPDWLHRCTLVTRYEVRGDGTVWSTLQRVLGPDGKVYEDFWKLPLDYREVQELHANGRKVVLRDRTIAGLQSWLIKEGLTTAENIQTTK